MSEANSVPAIGSRARRGFEPDKSVLALGWIGKTVECREDGGLYEERGHFVTVAAADDRPDVGGIRICGFRGEWGWFRAVNEDYPDGITLHSSEVYPPENNQPREPRGEVPEVL